MSPGKLEKILFEYLTDTSHLNGVEDYPKDSIKTYVKYDASNDVYIYEVSANQGKVEEEF
jgi:hypothetical protein